MSFEKIGFIAPSTCLPRQAKARLKKTAGLLKRAFGVKDIYFSPHLFLSDQEIDHVTAPADERAEVFKKAIRELDLIISVAGGTGAEDILRRIDKKDYRIIRERRPLFIGFSDFTFLLNEIYYVSRVPAIYFPSLKLGKGNFKKIFALISGEEIQYRGRTWLTAPPPRKLSGIPIGGNLSTFVNFLNRKKPPRFSWRRHVLFIEDIQVDVEDLHRLLAALRRCCRLSGPDEQEPPRPETAKGGPKVRPDLSRRRDPGTAEERVPLADPGRLQLRPQHPTQPHGRPHRRESHDLQGRKDHLPDQAPAGQERPGFMTRGR
jgi:muramoyltetrapeptide carboxypeptidase LdcA involved in peptidoglycan recycling